MSDESVHPIKKDIDVLAGFERKVLKPSSINILEQQVSVNEAFDSSSNKKVDPFAINQQGTASSLQTRWSKYKNFCLGSFQTRASDFAKSDIPVLFSRRVRDRLAELAVTSDEAAQITLMQQNEEKLREMIKKQSKKLEELHKDGKHWEMIELVSSSCKLLSNTKSPQFYPAQFMMVLDLVECFGKMVYDRIASYPTSKGDFLKESAGCTQLLSLNWSMILCRTSQLLPRLLLQTAFLRCIKFHPFKTFEQSVEQIANGINGLGSASAGIYARSYLIYTVFTLRPNASPELLVPLFTSYINLVKHLKNGSFKRQYSALPDYTFEKYIETHRPALNFFIAVMNQVGDSNLLKDALNEFYSLGEPSSFILSSLLDELSPKFTSKIFPVLLHLIDNADATISKPELIFKLITSLNGASSIEGVLEVMNEIWARMKEFPEVEDFVYVAAPLTRFITKFCSLHYVNLFLTNVVALLKQNFASREIKANSGSGSRSLTNRLTSSVMECIFATVKSSKNFLVVLTHISPIVTLMDFLDEQSLVEVSRFILNDVSEKPFQLNDPLCVRILLELSQVLFQSLSVLSPVDVIEKTNQTIVWFLYRVDFGTNIEAHLNFLLSARTAFPTGPRLLSAIARIALRLCTNAFKRKVSNLDVVTRTLLAFAFVTIPSISDAQERASLYILAANVALICCVSSFAHSCFDEFLKAVKDCKPTKELYILFQHAMCLLLVLPARPGVDPFEIVRNLIKTVMNISWLEDEQITFALDSIIVCGHMLRPEFVLKIENVDSNDVLYAGNPEYCRRGLSVINQMLNRFTDSLISYKKKGVVIAKKRVPLLCMKAIGTLADVFVCDKGLILKLAELADISAEGTSIDEIRELTGVHLEKAFISSELGKRYIAKYFSTD
jgi:hypothetical protein